MTTPPRILVLSASVGAGHVRAAEAVTLALRQLAPAATVQSVDVLTLTNALFRRLYAKTYLDMVHSAPHLVGLMYDISDKAARPDRVLDRLRMLVERVNTAPLVELLRSEPWDVVVNTHFLAPEIIASLLRRRKTRIPQMTVVTDIDAHGLWVHKPTERYFAATEQAAMSLRRWGVPGDNVTITGIPIHPLFSEPKDRAAMREKHGLLRDRPVVLLLTGGEGLGPVEGLFRAMLGSEVASHIVVVCGRNEPLRGKLQRIAPGPHHRTTILGFTREMDELLAAADLVVGKPGGLTTSECLARGVPMAVVNPIPGQESRNSDYLLENGAAIKINSIPLAGWKISGLLRDRERLARMRQNASNFGRPRAAFEVAAVVLKSVAARC